MLSLHHLSDMNRAGPLPLLMIWNIGKAQLFSLKSIFAWLKQGYRICQGFTRFCMFGFVCSTPSLQLCPIPNSMHHTPWHQCKRKARAALVKSFGMLVPVKMSVLRCLEITLQGRTSRHEHDKCHHYCSRGYWVQYCQSQPSLHIWKSALMSIISEFCAVRRAGSKKAAWSLSLFASQPN